MTESSEARGGDVPREEDVELGQVRAYLLRPEVASFEAALREPDDVDPYEVDPATGLSGILYVARRPANPPPWIPFAEAVTGANLDYPENWTLSAVLFLQRGSSASPSLLVSADTFLIATRSSATTASRSPRGWSTQMRSPASIRGRLRRRRFRLDARRHVGAPLPRSGLMSGAKCCGRLPEVWPKRTSAPALSAPMRSGSQLASAQRISAADSTGFTRRSRMAPIGRDSTPRSVADRQAGADVRQAKSAAGGRPPSSAGAAARR